MADRSRLYRMAETPATKDMVNDFVKFINDSVTPFHAVANMKKMLTGAGFTYLVEGSNWPELAKGGKYFVTRNDSSIVAFTVGGKYEQGNGFKITGAHTDSPNLMLKPRYNTKKAAYFGVGVQPYGGGLWHTWFDRELTVAGRVLVQKKGEDRVRKALVNLKDPIMRIPSLCIHLRDAADRNKLEPNKDNHVHPLIATELMAKAVEEAVEGAKADNILSRLLAEAAGCTPEEILDFDLSVVDTQPAVVGGAYKEFVFAPRLDNLMSCYACLKALIETEGSVAEDKMVRMVAMFDNEECGSSSSPGAAGSLIPDLLERLCPDTTKRTVCIANSFLMSVDGAHCAHPNYMDKHEEHHRPNLHEGPVIKYNANQRYATTGATAATVKALAKRCDVPIQEFVVRNESPCGSTIGPILTTLSGIKGVDIGNAMLSMHSIRETCGTVDLVYMKNLMMEFYANYEKAMVDVEPLE